MGSDGLALASFVCSLLLERGARKTEGKLAKGNRLLPYFKSKEGLVRLVLVIESRDNFESEVQTYRGMVSPVVLSILGGGFRFV